MDFADTIICYGCVILFLPDKVFRRMAPYQNRMVDMEEFKDSLCAAVFI